MTSCCGESTPAFSFANVSVWATLIVTLMSRSKSLRASMTSLSRPATATVNSRSGPGSAANAGPSMKPQTAAAVAAVVVARNCLRVNPVIWLIMAPLSGGLHLRPRLHVLVEAVGQEVGEAVPYQLADVVETDLLDPLRRQQLELPARAHAVIEVVGEGHGELVAEAVVQERPRRRLDLRILGDDVVREPHDRLLLGDGVGHRHAVLPEGRGHGQPAPERVHLLAPQEVDRLRVGCPHR